MTAENRPGNAAQSIGQLMSGAESNFGRILKRARAISLLNQRVMGLLDPELARNCQVANVRKGCMVFVCTSSGSATRLRMQSHKLIADLHAAGLEEIHSVEVRMDVPRGNARTGQGAQGS